MSEHDEHDEHEDVNHTIDHVLKSIDDGFMNYQLQCEGEFILEVFVNANDVNMCVTSRMSEHGFCQQGHPVISFGKETLDLRFPAWFTVVLPDYRACKACGLPQMQEICDKCVLISSQNTCTICDETRGQLIKGGGCCFVHPYCLWTKCYYNEDAEDLDHPFVFTCENCGCTDVNMKKFVS